MSQDLFKYQDYQTIKKMCKEKQEEQELRENLGTISFNHVHKKDVFSKEIENTLFIIGNGFDLMHGIPSSYYNFRDWISPNHSVKFALEAFIHVDNVWGDFESSLAYLDRASMLGTVDMWFDLFDVLDEDDDDFSAADYFAAQEVATTPIYTLTQELPQIFRKWIQSLEYKGNVKPLEGLLNKEAYYINFNYTEFLETIYGVHKKNIVYIHGDRRDKQSELVLGHGHDTDQVFEEWYQSNKSRKEYQPQMNQGKVRYDKNDDPVYLAYFLKNQKLGNWKSQIRYDGIHNMVSEIESYYEDSAKKTRDVLKKNKKYFESLDNIKNIVVLGHSLSDVDDPYFREIIKNNKDETKIHWYFSWYNEEGLNSIVKFALKMKIAHKNINVFKV